MTTPTMNADAFIAHVDGMDTTSFSTLYQSSDPAAYAGGVDKPTFLSDARLAAVKFSIDSSTAGKCAHAPVAFLGKVREHDPKINAVLEGNPSWLLDLMRDEAMVLIHGTRERLTHICGS